MKKFLLSLLLVVPFSVNAMAVSETFDVGDSVIVALKEGDTEETGGRAFHVLKPSAAGEETVTLIFDGTADEKRSDGTPVSPTFYDEVTPGEHEPTTILEKATIYNSLIEGTKTWRVESRRLLTVEDLKELGIDKEIKSNYSWLAPIVLKSDLILPEDYNYWTQSATEDSTAESPKVYCVTATSDNSNGVYATLESKTIGEVSGNPKCAVRPVVVVKKEYILCNNSKPTTTTTKAPQVDTGVEDYYLPLGLVMGASILGYLILRKKNVFDRI